LDKAIKIIFTIILIFIFLYAFSSSYTSHSIDALAYVIALGIDTTDNDKMKVSFQFVDTSSYSKEGSSEGNGSIVETVEASSIDVAINLMNTYMGKEINLSHCKAVVFSEDFAKDGIDKEIYSLINNTQLRPTANIIISKCEANYYIENSTSTLEKVITKYYDVFPKSSKYTGYTSNITIGKFFNELYDANSGTTAILGGINTDSSDSTSNNENDFDIVANDSTIIGERETENIGLAVFDNTGKLIGELTAIETLCHTLVTNEVSTFLISVPNPQDENANIDLSISPCKKANINVDTSGSSPYITISMQLTAKILTINTNNNYLDENYLTNISQSAKNYFNSIMTEYLYRTSTVFNNDIDHFSNYAVKNFFTTFDFNNYKWIENYKNTVFNVNIDINTESSLLLTES
jgi:spore germination protein KC